MQTGKLLTYLHTKYMKKVVPIVIESGIEKIIRYKGQGCRVSIFGFVKIF